MDGSTLDLGQIVKGDQGIAGTSYGIMNVYQPGHGFIVGNVLYRAPGAFGLAIATALVTSIVAGIVRAVIDQDHFTLYMPGSLIDTLSGLTDGQRYYVSPDAAGIYVPTSPSPNSYIPTICLIAVSATSGIVMNEIVSTGAVLLLGEVRMSVGPVDPATLNNPAIGDLWVNTNP